MEKIGRMLFFIGISFSLMSCSVYQNKDVGKVVGTIGGGLIGSAIGQGTGRVLATGAGMVAGFIIGNAIGYAMDNTLARKINGSLYYNQTNQSSCWVDGYSGTRYVITPTSDIIDVNDVPACRKYRLSVINRRGNVLQERGIACMLPDETWKVLKCSPVPGVGIFRELTCLGF